MTDRLKQIWAGFEGVTTRRLTGRGVENIEVPHRRDLNAREEDFLPRDFTSPADAAFAALRRRLSAAEQRQLRRDERRRRGETQEFSAPPAPLSPGSSQDGAPEAVRDLIRGLKATEARVARRDFDYGVWLADSQNGRSRRKKFLGLF